MRRGVTAAQQLPLLPCPAHLHSHLPFLRTSAQALLWQVWLMGAAQPQSIVRMGSCAQQFCWDPSSFFSFFFMVLPYLRAFAPDKWQSSQKPHPCFPPCAVTALSPTPNGWFSQGFSPFPQHTSLLHLPDLSAGQYFPQC